MPQRTHRNSGAEPLFSAPAAPVTWQRPLAVSAFMTRSGMRCDASFFPIGGRRELTRINFPSNTVFYDIGG